MASDEVRLHGVTVGRVSVDLGGRRGGMALRASLQFAPDHVGIMHAAARAMDKGEDR